MNFRIKYLLFLTLTISVLPLPVYTQTAAPEILAASLPDTSNAEAVVITGSTLKRTDYEGPATVLVLDRKKIDQSGVRTLNELIQRLPENLAGFSESVFPGTSFSPGGAAASLRGLGDTATLVLLNGRRIAPFPLAQFGTDAFFDLNSIPLSAVERVEVLKEGASAIYGSDAIAGVINVILKDHYNGGETETYYGNSTRNDSGEFRQTFSSGISNEKFRLFLSGNYFHRSSLASVDRPYSATTDKRRFGGSDLRDVNANPGTILLPEDGGSLAVPRGSNGRLTVGDFKPATRSNDEFRNLFNSNQYNELIPETERWGGLLTFGYNVTSHFEVFGEAFYQAVQTKTVLAPSPINSEIDTISIPATNPFNPFGTSVGLNWRSLETGVRRDTTDLDAYRYLTGVRVNDLPHNWMGEAAVLYSGTNVVDYSNAGFLSLARTQAALNDRDPKTALNVFGDGFGINNPTTLRSLIIRPRANGQAYIWNYDIRASGELYQLPAGPLSLAVGGEYREESLTQTYSEPLGSIIGFGGAGSAGDRDVRSALCELAIPITSGKWNTPLLRALEFSFAERYDDYSDFGGAAKPKFGFKWKPFDGLLFRGSYSEGFRAPSLPQLFTGTINSFDEITVPGQRTTRTVSLRTGGNPALLPETSYSQFLSAIVEPPFIKGLSVEADFYRIEQRNLISQPSTQDIVDGKAPGLITRNSNGDIQSVGALYANLGTVVVDGVDLSLTYRRDTSIGTFTFDTRSSFMNSYELRQPFSPNLDLTDGFALPEFKMVNSLFYHRGNFETGVTLNYIDSYDDVTPTPGHTSHTIGSWTTVDLQVSYEWIFEPKSSGGLDDGKGAIGPGIAGLNGWQRLLNGTKVTVGILNVGDSEPPLANVEEGYDPQTTDPTGRFIYASLRKKFW